MKKLSEEVKNLLNIKTKKRIKNGIKEKKSNNYTNLLIEGTQMSLQSLDNLCEIF